MGRGGPSQKISAISFAGLPRHTRGRKDKLERSRINISRQVPLSFKAGAYSFRLLLAPLPPNDNAEGCPRREEGFVQIMIKLWKHLGDVWLCAYRDWAAVLSSSRRKFSRMSPEKLAPNVGCITRCQW
ncbi:hypothetical protein TNCV_3629181 [Trichonephila clavipes]|nr:hypothetical protein TNCV_3629181 [Trichonephila clavipes]